MTDWTLDKLQELYDLPLIELFSKAHLTHVQNHKIGEIQVCTLISIKTGGCSEDCHYCSQSSRYQTFVIAQPMMKVEEALALAKKAKERGASRVCLVAAWKEVRDNKAFEEILKMVECIKDLNVEVCCCLGMVSGPQARRLKEAGAYAYNHNLDSSEEFYKTIITTRSYQDRLKTLDAVVNAGITVCSGGILGLGEEPLDRLKLLLNLCTRHPQPESVPINQLTPVPGTPLENQEKISTWEMLRIISLARITMPKAMIRLSSGRIKMSYEEQALYFFAGANSIHAGEKLITLTNHSVDKDEELFQILGLTKKGVHESGE